MPTPEPPDRGPRQGARIAGDDIGKEEVNPFHLTFSDGFAAWLARHRVALAFTTYTGGKIVMVGPGLGGGLAVSERSFDKAMALLPTETGFHLSTAHQVWRCENSLPPGRIYDGFDRVYLPRSCHVTGGVDLHDLAYGRDGELVAAITLYNCLATLDDRGSFNPIWRPRFIDAIVGEDRCHLNGFCVDDGIPAFVSLVAESNSADGWRAHRADGGQVIELRGDAVVADGLAMPHSPRLHRGRLWLLEAGTGWFGWVDLEARRFVRLTWCPGFVRGLRFLGDQALVGLSRPRDRTFQGLPLEEELAKRDAEPVCGLYVIDLRDGSLVHRLTITGSVEEIYDVALLPEARAPLLIGLQGPEIGRLVYLGPDASDRSAES